MVEVKKTNDPSYDDILQRFIRIRRELYVDTQVNYVAYKHVGKGACETSVRRRPPQQGCRS